MSARTRKLLSFSILLALSAPAYTQAPGDYEGEFAPPPSASKATSEARPWRLVLSVFDNRGSGMLRLLSGNGDRAFEYAVQSRGEALDLNLTLQEYGSEAARLVGPPTLTYARLGGSELSFALRGKRVQVALSSLRLLDSPPSAGGGDDLAGAYASAVLANAFCSLGTEGTSVGASLRIQSAARGRAGVAVVGDLTGHDGREEVAMVDVGLQRFIVFMGTAQVGDWVGARGNVTPFSERYGAVRVHEGFLNGFAGVRPRVLAAMKDGRRIHLVGHSRGGALASIATLAALPATNVRPYLTTFGAPSAGNADFATLVGSVVAGQARWVNQDDPVPMTGPIGGTHLSPAFGLRSYDGSGTSLVGIEMVPGGFPAGASLELDAPHGMEVYTKRLWCLWAQERLPLRVSAAPILLLDRSGSLTNATGAMAQLQGQARLAMEDMLRQVDEVAIVNFSGPGSAVVDAPFTADRDRLTAAISRPTIGGSGTAIYNAINDAVLYGVRQGKRPMIIVFTDGVNHLGASFHEALTICRRHQAAVLVVGFSGTEGRNTAELERLAKATQGFYSANEKITVRDLVRRYARYITSTSSASPTRRLTDD